MQLLGRPPGAAIAVFPQMLHNQPNVLQMTDAGLGMSEPKALRVSANQFAGPLDECRRCRHCGRSIVGLFGHQSHCKWLATGGGSGKAAVALLHRRSLGHPFETANRWKFTHPLPSAEGPRLNHPKGSPPKRRKPKTQTSIKTHGLGDSGAFCFRFIVLIVVVHPFGQNEASAHWRGHGGLGTPD